MGEESTYIWMASNLFDDVVIEMTRIAQQSAGNVVGMLQTAKDGVLEWELTSLSKLGPLVLSVHVDVLYPAVVGAGTLV